MNRVIAAGLMAESLVMHMDSTRGRGVFNMQVRKWASKHNHQVLGNGCYGIAVRHATEGFVLKVCSDPDDGYPYFAEYAMHNPHPGMVDIFYAARIDEELFVSAMPEYDDLPDGDLELSVQRMVSLGDTNADELADACEAVRRLRGVFLEVLHEDMHTGNFLVCRETGRVVVSDPYANRYNDHEYTIHMVAGQRVPQQIELDLLHSFEEPTTDYDALARDFTELVQEMALIPADFTGLELRVMKNRPRAAHNPLPYFDPKFFRTWNIEHIK